MKKELRKLHMEMIKSTRNELKKPRVLQRSDWKNESKLKLNARWMKSVSREEETTPGKTKDSLSHLCSTRLDSTRRRSWMQPFLCEATSIVDFSSAYDLSAKILGEKDRPRVFSWVKTPARMNIDRRRSKTQFFRIRFPLFAAGFPAAVDPEIRVSRGREQKHAPRSHSYLNYDLYSAGNGRNSGKCNFFSDGIPLGRIRMLLSNWRPIPRNLVLRNHDETVDICIKRSCKDYGISFWILLLRCGLLIEFCHCRS